MSMARDPYFNRLQHGSYLDRMVSARDVAWFRNPDGSFTVTWTDAGERRTEIFKTERSALRFARMLDTTGVLPTERDVLEAEAALRQLEKEVMTKEDREDQRLAMESLAELENMMALDTKEEVFERERAYASLHELEPYVQRRGGDIPVKKHSRRIK